jgi:hypothetical protein
MPNIAAFYLDVHIVDLNVVDLDIDRGELAALAFLCFGFGF